MTIGEKIRELRIAKGWTQRDLSIASDVTSESICRIEKNHKGKPYKSTLKAIAVALNCTVEELKGE
jgi:transcriptional regulator with XRE-family HTH domain